MVISVVQQETRKTKSEEIVKSRIARGTTLVKRGFAQMQKHGVVMDITNSEQAQDS